MIDVVLMDVEEKMEKAIESLKFEFKQIRTGRASAGILDGIEVDYYGMPTPINQMATVSVPEARLLVIKAFDKSTLKDIERALNEADLGITPNSDGEVIRLNFPALTEERRKEYVKKLGKLSEDAKVRVRNARRDGNDELKKVQKAGDITEDELSGAQNDVQKLTDKYVAKVDAEAKAKEADIMTI